MNVEYFRHEYTWSNHCISGNKLGWGITASSTPKEKERLRELEKLAFGAEIDKTGKIVVEELTYSPSCGFVKMVSTPCTSGEDHRQNKQVQMYQPATTDWKEPGVYLMPAGQWESQPDSSYLSPIRMDITPLSIENILETMNLSDRLPEFMQAVFWCLLGKEDGLTIVAPSWKEEEFARKAAEVMYLIHSFLPGHARSKAGYVSFVRENTGAAPICFSQKPCGTHWFSLDVKGSKEEENDEMERYFFQGIASDFREHTCLWDDFLKTADQYLQTAKSMGNLTKKLQWIYYDAARKNGKEEMDFLWLIRNLPELFYWTRKEDLLLSVAENRIREIHAHSLNKKERKIYVESLLAGMTGRSREQILRELDWILMDVFRKDKSQFARLLALIREKNQDVYTCLLCRPYPEKSASYGKALFEKNAETLERLQNYVSDFNEQFVPDLFKDHILRTGISLLNQNLFQANQYQLFDQIAVTLHRTNQWAKILEDFVGQLEASAGILDKKQLETACYVENLLCQYQPKRTVMVLREEREHRLGTRKKRMQKSQKTDEEDYDMGRRYKGEQQEIKETEFKPMEETDMEGPFLPFFLSGFPHGFLTGCIIYLSHYTLMIGHWKIAVGMAGMWILLMLNYQCILVQKKIHYPLWKVLGLCLVEGWIIEIAGWFFQSQKIRLYYFVVLGIISVVIQGINLIRMKRAADRETERDLQK